MDVGRVDDDLGQQAVVENVLANGDEERAAEGLEEHAHRCAGGHVLEREDGLDRDQGLLHAEADAEAVDDLVADPHAVAGADLEGGQEAGADG